MCCSHQLLALDKYDQRNRRELLSSRGRCRGNGGTMEQCPDVAAFTNFSTKVALREGLGSKTFKNILAKQFALAVQTSFQSHFQRGGIELWIMLCSRCALFVSGIVTYRAHTYSPLFIPQFHINNYVPMRKALPIQTSIH